MSHAIRYEFDFDEQETVFYDVEINDETLALQSIQKTSSPAWTKLEFQKCECCPLSKEEFLFCPLAANISEIVERFSGVDSHIDCTTKVITEDRTYIRETSVQDGLFSLMGLVMGASECPEMEVFRPMARFHLPFSSDEETIVRTASMYLLKQFFEHKRGLIPDLNLERLREQYKKIEQVNQGLINRIKNITSSDSNKNALVILNSWAQMLSVEIEDNLGSIEYLFYTDIGQGEAERLIAEREAKVEMQKKIKTKRSVDKVGKEKKGKLLGFLSRKGEDDAE